MSKARPRVVERNGKRWAFTPEATKSWEDAVFYEVKQQIARMSPRPVLPFKNRTCIELWFWKHKPRSYPKSVVWNTKKPDVDNLAKAVIDALETAGVIENDNIITDLYLHKRYTDVEHPDEGVGIVIDGDL